MVLQAPDKAVLSFSGPLNLARAELTKLKGRGWKAKSRSGAGRAGPVPHDALSIVTRNVQILPEQIWTAHDVVFEYGANRGSGRDLSITLSPGGAASGNKDALIKNLEAMELAHLDRLTLQIPAKGTLSNLFPDKPPPRIRLTTSRHRCPMRPR